MKGEFIKSDSHNSGNRHIAGWSKNIPKNSKEKTFFAQREGGGIFCASFNQANFRFVSDLSLF